ncbi:MAG: hypothetical protein EBW20_05840, partial [Betaproteobacteria bacterium]|nr:hypothetical protein [Betaproteobacteria bacterium]
IHWDEFWQVVQGDGPCNRERLNTRRFAHEQGKWVREAAQAYAKKRAQGNHAAQGSIETRRQDAA